MIHRRRRLEYSYYPESTDPNPNRTELRTIRVYKGPLSINATDIRTSQPLVRNSTELENRILENVSSINHEELLAASGNYRRYLTVPSLNPNLNHEELLVASGHYRRGKDTILHHSPDLNHEVLLVASGHYRRDAEKIHVDYRRLTHEELLVASGCSRQGDDNIPQKDAVFGHEALLVVSGSYRRTQLTFAHRRAKS